MERFLLQSSISYLLHYRDIPVVGGHAGMLGDGVVVMKPLQAGPRSQAEVRFYSQVFRGGRANQPPATFMPRFHGVSTREVPGVLGHSSVKSYIVLDDVTAAHKLPCIMDVKVGVQTWDENAPAEKAAAEMRKYPLQQQIGFRFTGMRVWNASAGDWKEHGRAFGYRLDAGSLGRVFSEYLHDGQRVRTELIPPFLAKLRQLEAWFETQNQWRFYGSSLLFVYDAAAAEPHVDVVMIDFAHVWPITDGPQGRDNGYLLGLRNVIAYLEALLHAAEEEQLEKKLTVRIATHGAAPAVSTELPPHETAAAATALMRLAAATSAGGAAAAASA